MKDNLTCWWRTTRTPSWSGPPAQQGTHSHYARLIYYLVLVERKWSEPWLFFPVRCCREMYRTNSCRGDPASRPGTARWTQKQTGTAIRQPLWVQDCVQTRRWSKVCPHWPVESSARRSRWTGRREASARSWRGSHRRDPHAVRQRCVQAVIFQQQHHFEWC